ncbi:MAG: formate dehydrogenase [Desulfobacterales bacterium]|nr:formate dehydrogenase [Desulfobacterales bacterium]
MAETLEVKVKDKDTMSSLRGFFKSILELEDMDAMLVPVQLPMKDVVMPALVTRPGDLENANPLEPVFPLNAAKLVSRLTQKSSGGKIAAVLRPCEIRAFIELVKLKQGNTDSLLIIGLDCPGAYNNMDYLNFIASGKDRAESMREFLKSAFSKNGAGTPEMEIATACQACEHPVPDNADIAIGLFGVDFDDHLLVIPQTDSGAEVLEKLDLKAPGKSAERDKVIADIEKKRVAFRDNMFDETRKATDSMEKLTEYLAGCVNCYNCRVACPVCYCKECVFLTDVFDHDPSQYLKWSRQKGTLKMPTDTVFYHLTRMAHMSTACVGCGQCSNACPNDIPVMELLRTVAQQTQEVFDYEAGRNIDEAPPLSVFLEEELEDVVGIS